MLKFMRKHATGCLVKALFGVIIIVFIFWGVGSFRDSDKVIAEVGPYKIFHEEYQEVYKNLINTYRLIYKDKLDENLLKELKIKEKVVNEIIDKHLLLLQAKKMGIGVSDEEFNEHVRNMDVFKMDGKFSENLYAEVLKKNRIDPKKFEEAEKNALVLRKITNIISNNSAFYDEKDLWTSYVKERGMVNLSYMQFNSADYKEKVNVDENEVQALYEKEKSIYRNENIYRFKYIVIDEKSTLKDDAVYMELLKSSDIDSYGKKNNLEVGDTGSLKEGELLKKFKDFNIIQWVRELKAGDISLPVRAGSKSYIFKLITAEEGKPFDKAVIMKEIKDKIVLDKAKSYAKAAAEEVIRKKSFVHENQTGFIRRNTDSIPAIGVIPEVNIDLLSLDKDRIVYEKPVEISGKIYVFSFKEEKVPEKQEWDKNKKQYATYIAAKKDLEYFRSIIENLKNREKIKINWSEI